MLGKNLQEGGLCQLRNQDWILETARHNGEESVTCLKSW